LVINLYADDDREVQVLIYTVTGQLVKTGNHQVKKGYATITMDGFRGWNSGVYTIKVLSGKETYVERMVLVK
jgi:hypothetical protein